MSESPEDKDVDSLIADLERTLAKLKAAQAKDVADESGEEDTERDDQPKSLRAAGSETRRRYAKARGD